MSNKYEFEDTDAEILWKFGNKLSIVAILLGTGALFGIITSLLNLFEEETTSTIVNLFEFIFLLGISIIIYFPSDNFKSIATSEGRDIDELMRGFKEFNMAFLAISGLIIVVGILNFILLFR
ncbi:MAG: hypothetical protein INQ03_22660 [Candidatus Heimdallarchaeota archaeon]|nr:hypothetical protein [Candidatus Heimdallarchaeota archaeon]